MASSPTFLSSVDDWYITGKGTTEFWRTKGSPVFFNQGLLVTETTNEFYNDTLNTLVTDRGVMSWMRVRFRCCSSWDVAVCVIIFSQAMAANHMAETGHEWANIFARANAGTYNNQVRRSCRPSPNNTCLVDGSGSGSLHSRRGRVAGGALHRA
jgi:hypothetical protein